MLLLPYYLPRRQHLLHVCIKFNGNSDATRVVQNFPKKMKGYVFISLSISYIKVLSHHIRRRCRKCDKQVNKKLPSVLIESQEPQFTVFFCLHSQKRLLSSIIGIKMIKNDFFLLCMRDKISELFFRCFSFLI